MWRESILDRCRNQIASILRPEGLRLNLAWCKVGLNDFPLFSNKWSQVHEAIQERKHQPFREFGYGLFQPIPPEVGRDSQFDQLAENLLHATGYRIKRLRGMPSPDWRRPINALGYDVEFIPSGVATDAVVFNTTDFVGQWQGFRFVVKDVPIADGQVIDFDALAEQALKRTGTRKLGVLKMDVDNLGLLFSKGLPNNLRSISRVASLSRALRWFFEAYMNNLLKDFNNDIYPVFSGGDDFFVVGAWDKIFEFARTVREKFRKFVCNHPRITLSAALLVVDEKYPVAQFARLAEDHLYRAKGKRPEKNCISVFGIPLTWDEFEEVAVLKDKLVTMVNELNESRAIIEKVQRSSIGFEKLQEAAWNKKIRPPKVWRLAYYLRDVGKSRDQTELEKKQSKEIAEELVGQYESLLFDAMQGKAVNPSIFPVAARWAEFATKRSQ